MLIFTSWFQKRWQKEKDRGIVAGYAENIKPMRNSAQQACETYLQGM
jgi:GH25 family lysozyme M1 (1,4-beta-N-acetylmuramidase)